MRNNAFIRWEQVGEAMWMLAKAAWYLLTAKLETAINNKFREYPNGWKTKANQRLVNYYRELKNKSHKHHSGCGCK